MKITFTARVIGGEEIVADNEAYAKSLGFPRLGEAGGPLAVVGGGPSIAGHIDELREFDGEIWAINGAWRWCKDNGIEAVFFTIDRAPALAHAVHGVKRALLAMCCAPALFDALEGADVEAVRVGGENGFPTGVTSATAAGYIAVLKGHNALAFYGCESSFALEGCDHAYHAPEAHREIIQVVCNGETFVTKPGLMMQAQHLAEQVNAAPHVFEDRSGGLLAACIADSDIDVIAGSQSLHDRIYAP